MVLRLSSLNQLLERCTIKLERTESKFDFSYCCYKLCVIDFFQSGQGHDLILFSCQNTTMTRLYVLNAIHEMIFVVLSLDKKLVRLCMTLKLKLLIASERQQAA